MSMARRLAQQNEGWFDVNQYDNLDNPEGHYRLYLIFSTLPTKYFPARTLGPEIWSQTVGRVTHFVAGGSTGGTISGTGRYNTGRSLVTIILSCHWLVTMILCCHWLVLQVSEGQEPRYPVRAGRPPRLHLPRVLQHPQARHTPGPLSLVQRWAILTCDWSHDHNTRL